MINIKVGGFNSFSTPEMWTGKILTFDAYIVTHFFVTFHTRTHLDKLIWKSYGNKKIKPTCEPEVEQELSRMGAGGGCSSSVHTVLEHLR